MTDRRCHRGRSQQQQPPQLRANRFTHIAKVAIQNLDEEVDHFQRDELIILLAANMLNEVADIATASGVELRPADLANAMKQMILRYQRINQHQKILIKNKLKLYQVVSS